MHLAIIINPSFLNLRYWLRGTRMDAWGGGGGVVVMVVGGGSVILIDQQSKQINLIRNNPLTSK